MKRRFYAAADNIGAVRRWRIWDFIPLGALAIVIYQGYSIKDMQPETGVFLLVLLGVSTLICNPFGLLTYVFPPASRWSISVGVLLVYVSVEIRYNVPESPLYPLGVAVISGMALIAMGVKFRPRWLETWRKQDRDRRYRLTILQSDMVDRVIGALSSNSAVAASEAWDAYGCAMCRSVIHQAGGVEVSEEILHDVGFACWATGQQSAWMDRTDLLDQHSRELRKLEEKLETMEIDRNHWKNQYYGLNPDGSRNYEQELKELQAQLSMVWAENSALKTEKKALKELLEEQIREPDLEDFEESGAVIRLFRTAAQDDAEEVEEQEPEEMATPRYYVAGVMAPVDLTETQKKDLQILEFHEQDKKHSAQVCADHFGLNHRQTAYSAIQRGKKLREQLRTEAEESREEAANG